MEQEHARFAGTSLKVLKGERGKVCSFSFGFLWGNGNLMNPCGCGTGGRVQIGENGSLNPKPNSSTVGSNPKRRQKYLLKMERPRLTTVLVEDLDHVSVKTDEELRHHFDQIFGRAVVKSAHMVKNTEATMTIKKKIDDLEHDVHVAKVKRDEARTPGKSHPID